MTEGCVHKTAAEANWVDLQLSFKPDQSEQHNAFLKQ